MAGDERDSREETTSSIEPLSGVTPASGLQDVERRLSVLETRIGYDPSNTGRARTASVEILKVLFGGWPAFGFLFLLLFYQPLYQALKVIPEKIERAAEISGGGWTLKERVRREASSLGLGSLAEIIPSLSRSATELLFFQAPPRKAGGEPSYEGLFGQGIGCDPIADGEFDCVIPVLFYPSGSKVSALVELENKGLANIVTCCDDYEPAEAAQISAIMSQFQREHPGVSSSGDEGTLKWTFEDALPENAETPQLSWAPTRLGRTAISLVQDVVASEFESERPKD